MSLKERRNMTIKIRRTEREIITGRGVPYDESVFEDREAAFRFLSDAVPIITEEHMDEIMQNPTTNFEYQNLILRADVAFSATLVYEIEVK